MTSQLPETTPLVWYRSRCRKSYKVQPPTEDPACRCKTPVPSLRPTQVTVMHAPKRRPLHALSDEEARIRALPRKGTKVRVTFRSRSRRRLAVVQRRQPQPWLHRSHLGRPQFHHQPSTARSLHRTHP